MFCRFANLSVGLSGNTAESSASLATNLLTQNNVNSSLQPIYINQPINSTSYDNSAVSTIQTFEILNQKMKNDTDLKWVYIFQSNANYVEIDQIYPLTQENNIYTQPSYNHLNSPIYQNTKTSVISHTAVQNTPTTPIYSNTNLERYHSQPQGISYGGEPLANHIRYSLRRSESNQGKFSLYILSTNRIQKTVKLQEISSSFGLWNLIPIAVHLVRNL